jgi:hypothetical protein
MNGCREGLACQARAVSVRAGVVRCGMSECRVRRAWLVGHGQDGSVSSDRTRGDRGRCRPGLSGGERDRNGLFCQERPVLD